MLSLVGEVWTGILQRIVVSNSTKKIAESIVSEQDRTTATAVPRNQLNIPSQEEEEPEDNNNKRL